jgi:hypothetical protein
MVGCNSKTTGQSCTITCDQGYTAGEGVTVTSYDCTATGAAGAGTAEFFPPSCSAKECTETAVANSVGHTKAGSIQGKTTETVQVTCASGYYGGGTFKCMPTGTFAGTACSENVCGLDTITYTGGSAMNAAAATAEWVKVGCAIGTPLATTVTGLDTIQPAAGYSSCTVTCEAHNGKFKVVASQINECEAEVKPCDVNAVCTDTPGSFTCKCNPGYIGAGLAKSKPDDPIGCDPAKCAVPTDQDGRTLTDCADQKTADVGCQMSCDDGYKLIAGVKGAKTCTATGQTTSEFLAVPQCSAATCDEPTDLTGRTSTGCIGKVTEETCQVTCDDGYEDQASDSGTTSTQSSSDDDDDDDDDQEKDRSGEQTCTAIKFQDKSEYPAALLPNCAAVKCPDPPAQTGRSATNCNDKKTSQTGCAIQCDQGYKVKSGLEGAKTCTGVLRGKSAYAPALPICD